MEYVSLHHHSTFSYGDGFGRPEEHVARAADLGMSAMALTEHGNMSSHVQLEKASDKIGIKPIYGVEFYTASDLTSMRKWHLTVLAENLDGYRNLNHLVTRSYKEGFYRWPTVTGSMLAEHAEGLIVLSGCADSLTSCSLLGGKGIETGDERAALRVIERFRDLLGDRYYLECQMFPELERTSTINPWLAEQGRRLGIPLVATADCHYPMPDDNMMQLTLHAASRGANSAAEQAEGWEYDIRLTLPTSDAMVLDRLRGTGLSPAEATAALQATAEIAGRCDVRLPRAEPIKFPLKPGQTAHDLIWDWLRDGWRYRWDRNPHMRAHQADYVARLKYEMDMIAGKGFFDYFLVTSESVRWAKDNGIAVGPARGSAAASLASYLLRITEVDPMQFPTMVFERFIDVTREDLPDIDLDFASNRRHEVAEHLGELYGADHVGNIGNFTRYRGKNAVNDVGRVHKIPPWDTKIVKDLVIERSGGDSRFDASLEDTFLMFPQAAAVLEWWPILDQAVRLEGNYKGMSVHAAGVVVANTPLDDVCAVIERKVGKEKRTLRALGYDKKDAEYLGMLKMDFLGLSTMQMISDALAMIGMTLEELYQIPMTDEPTLEAFRNGDVIGIFQFEGRATRLVNRDVRPDNFLELADINALSRPGPLFSGATAQYVEVKHGRAEPEHLHPVVDEITKWSNYQIIYQEQILLIVRQVGGFPWTHASEIRKIISKKEGEAAFNVMVDMFVEGAERLHGIDKELAMKIWRQLVTSGTYAFNVAHCISYSMLGFWCMWLKVHHPAAFYAAQLRQTAKEKWPKLLRDAEDHDIVVGAPDLNLSGTTWSVGEGAVLAGFSQVPGIGEKLARVIVDDRQQRGDYADWAALERVKGVGPSKLDTIRAFAESDDPFQLRVVRDLLNAVRSEVAAGRLRLPRPTHTSGGIPPDADNLKVTWIGIPVARNYQDYIENQRSRTGEEIETIVARMKDKHLVTSCVLQCIDDGPEEVYVRFNRWAFPKFKEILEGLHIGEDIIVVQGIKKSGFGTSVHANKMFVLEANQEEEDTDEVQAS